MAPLDIMSAASKQARLHPGFIAAVPLLQWVSLFPLAASERGLLKTHF